jgi:phage terminase large subunit
MRALEKKEMITIVRKTIPSLKRTVMKDFKEIMQSLNVWHESQFNISDRLYTFSNDSQILFISTDDAEKLRGIKSSMLFIDEASEIDEESYFQLSIRTTGRIILAFNPTISPFHWLRQMQDCERYVTTYKNNPYLEKEIVRGIEELKYKNPKYWSIYGLGEYAANQRAVFNFDTIEWLPTNEDGEVSAEFVCFGLDFGFSQDPTALVSVWKDGQDLYFVEHLYERGMVTNDIHNFLKSVVNGREEIYADSAEGRLIEELYRLGWNIKPVKKGPDSIRFGISVMQNYNIKIPRSSQNLINEMYSYQYAVDKHQHTTDRPEDGLDHLIDAARYACMMRLSHKATTVGQYHIRVR